MNPNTNILFLLVVCTSILGDSVTAKPYFFWNDASVPQAPHHEHLQQVASNAAQQHQLMQDPLKQVKDPQTQVASSSSEEIQQRIHGHLNQLVSHGSSAMKSVMDTVQPDLKNIGKDISDVYQVTRDRVNKRIEPTLINAQKTVEPLINSAKEEVPKALNKMGEQVRGVWEKVSSIHQPDLNAAQKSPIGQAVDQIQLAANNAIHQPLQAAQQVAKP